MFIIIFGLHLWVEKLEGWKTYFS